MEKNLCVNWTENKNLPSIAFKNKQTNVNWPKLVYELEYLIIIPSCHLNPGHPWEGKLL